MMRDREDRVWIGTRNGVSLMENGRIYPGNQFPDLPDPKVRSILEDSKGDFLGSQPMVVAWQGTPPADRLPFWIPPITGYPTISSWMYSKTVTVSSGRLPMEGFVRIDGERTEVFNTDNGLANNNAMTLFEDSLGQIWIGTFDGISIYFGGQLRTLKHQ